MGIDARCDIDHYLSGFVCGENGQLLAEGSCTSALVAMDPIKESVAPAGVCGPVREQHECPAVCARKIMDFFAIVSSFFSQPRPPPVWEDTSLEDCFGNCFFLKTARWLCELLLEAAPDSGQLGVSARVFMQHGLPTCVVCLLRNAALFADCYLALGDLAFLVSELACPLVKRSLPVFWHEVARAATVPDVALQFQKAADAQLCTLVWLSPATGHWGQDSHA